MTETDWVVVFQTTDQVEIEIIRGLLTTNGFPVVVEKKGLKSMSFLFGESALGEYLLRVPPGMADAAKDLLNADAEMPEVDATGDKQEE